MIFKQLTNFFRQLIQFSQINVKSTFVDRLNLYQILFFSQLCRQQFPSSASLKESFYCTVWQTHNLKHTSQHSNFEQIAFMRIFNCGFTLSYHKNFAVACQRTIQCVHRCLTAYKKWNSCSRKNYLFPHRKQRDYYGIKLLRHFIIFVFRVHLQVSGFMFSNRRVHSEYPALRKISLIMIYILSSLVVKSIFYLRFSRFFAVVSSSIILLQTKLPELWFPIFVVLRFWLFVFQDSEKRVSNRKTKFRPEQVTAGR